MATPRSQRIAIWIITIVLFIGAVGMYFVMILANKNDTAERERTQQISAEYDRRVSDQTKLLSDKYYAEFSRYSSHVGSFDKESAQAGIVTEDLLAGDGEVIGDDSKFAAYYIGWNPDGKVFDQSINEATGSLKEPLFRSRLSMGMLGLDQGLKNASLIPGWKEGMKGMKVGGVRVMTIPSEQAYGSTGSGTDIPPNTPIKFVVMAIPLPEHIPEPAVGPLDY